MRPLDATLGRRRVRAHDLDAKLVKCSTILSHPVAANRGTLVDAENCVLVTVEGHRLAIALDVELGGLHVVEPRLALDESQQLKPTGSIVDVRERRAVWAAILKPVMF